MLKGATNKGFTLIELLVVIAIISLLSTVVFATVQESREKGRMAAAMQFESQLKHSTSDNLIGYWTFDDTSNPWKDYSSAGHNGTGVTLTPSPTVGYNGQNANLFNGTGYVSVGKGSDYLPFDTFSACAWVKSSGMAPGMTMNGIFTITYSITLNITPEGRLYSGLDNNGSPKYLSAPQNLYDDKFHFVCVTYDGKQRGLYIDGSLKAKDDQVWPGFSKWPVSAVMIGSNTNNPPAQMFNGVIDDVSLYAGAMTQAKIERLFALGKTKHDIK